MTTRGQDLAAVIKRQIEEFGGDLTMVDVGTVTEVGDGIARIHGLGGVQYTELLAFPGDVIGMAMNLEEDAVGAAIMGDDSQIKEGDEVRSTGRVAEVPVGNDLIGRTVDALGRPIDGKGPLRTESTRPIERVAPNVVTRQAVNVPVQTGIKAIDSMIPIGRGQRELIIGDRSTGKSAIALDAIINQKGGDLICIYVAIGQRVGKVAQTVAILEQYGAMEHTVVVAANASDPAPLPVPRSLCRMRHRRRVHGAGQGRPDNLRRFVQTRLGVPPAVVAAAQASRTGSLPRRRVLSAQQALGESGTAVQ